MAQPFTVSHDLTTEIININFKIKKKKKKKTYYLNKCESERDDELFFASKVNNQTNSHQIIE